ncbi:MAG: hypothetical protein PVSMB7_03390 [Chloroflexota bacterium]
MSINRLKRTVCIMLVGLGAICATAGVHTPLTGHTPITVADSINPPGPLGMVRNLG